MKYGENIKGVTWRFGDGFTVQASVDRGIGDGFIVQDVVQTTNGEVHVDFGYQGYQRKIPMKSIMFLFEIGEAVKCEYERRSLARLKKAQFYRLLIGSTAADWENDYVN